MTTALPSTIDRAAWLAERRSGIGGSDAAAVIGLSRWKTPLDVYLEKRGEAPERETSPAMFWGTTLEPVIRDVYAEQTGRVVRVPTVVLRHSAYPWMLGTIDGVTDDKRLVEIKTTRSADGWGDPGTDQIPEAYLVQVQHYLTVTALSVADVAVLIGGSDFRVYEVPADPELQEMLTEQEAAFWRRVVEGIPPDPVTLADARRRFPCSLAREVVASGVVKIAVSRLRVVREQIKSLESEADALQADVCKAMADADTLTDGRSVLATWKSGKPTARLDTTALKAAHPEIVAAFTRAGESSRRFLLKEAK